MISKFSFILCMICPAETQTTPFYYPPSSGISSCVGTAGTVTWCLHLTRPCYVPLGRVIISKWNRLDSKPGPQHWKHLTYLRAGRPMIYSCVLGIISIVQTCNQAAGFLDLPLLKLFLVFYTTSKNISSNIEMKEDYLVMWDKNLFHLTLSIGKKLS